MGAGQDLPLPSCGGEQSPGCAQSRTAVLRCLRVALAAGPVPLLQLCTGQAGSRRSQEANTSSVCCWAKPSSHVFPSRQLELFYKVQLCFTSQQINIFLPRLFCLISASTVFLRRIDVLFTVVLPLQTFSHTPITVPRMERSLSVKALPGLLAGSTEAGRLSLSHQQPLKVWQAKARRWERPS